MPVGPLCYTREDFGEMIAIKKCVVKRRVKKVKSIREIAKVLAAGINRQTKKEDEISKVVRRRIVPKGDIVIIAKISNVP